MRIIYGVVPRADIIRKINVPPFPVVTSHCRREDYPFFFLSERPYLEKYIHEGQEP